MEKLDYEKSVYLVRAPMDEKKHKNHAVYLNKFYDAYYCKTCDEWIEPTCGDPKCSTCQDRPQTPSQMGAEKGYDSPVRHY